MWLNDVDTVVFEYFGREYPIKDIRDIPEYPNFIVLDVSTQTTMDEVCVRNDVYGDETEDQSYRLFEANVVALTDANFSFSSIKSLRIPY